MLIELWTKIQLSAAVFRPFTATLEIRQYYPQKWNGKYQNDCPSFDTLSLWLARIFVLPKLLRVLPLPALLQQYNSLIAFNSELYILINSSAKPSMNSKFHKHYTNSYFSVVSEVSTEWGTTTLLSTSRTSTAYKNRNNTPLMIGCKKIYKTHI